MTQCTECVSPPNSYGEFLRCWRAFGNFFGSKALARCEGRSSTSHFGTEKGNHKQLDSSIPGRQQQTGISCELGRPTSVLLYMTKKALLSCISHCYFGFLSMQLNLIIGNSKRHRPHRRLSQGSVSCCMTPHRAFLSTLSCPNSHGGPPSPRCSEESLTTLTLSVCYSVAPVFDSGSMPLTLSTSHSQLSPTHPLNFKPTFLIFSDIEKSIE